MGKGILKSSLAKKVFAKSTFSKYLNFLGEEKAPCRENLSILKTGILRNTFFLGWQIFNLKRLISVRISALVSAPPSSSLFLGRGRAEILAIHVLGKLDVNINSKFLNNITRQ